MRITVGLAADGGEFRIQFHPSAQQQNCTLEVRKPEKFAKRLQRGRRRHFLLSGRLDSRALFQSPAHRIERGHQILLVSFSPVHVIFTFGPLYSSVLVSTSSALSAPSTRTRTK